MLCDRSFRFTKRSLRAERGQLNVTPFALVVWGSVLALPADSATVAIFSMVEVFVFAPGQMTVVPGFVGTGSLGDVRVALLIVRGLFGGDGAFGNAVVSAVQEWCQGQLIAPADARKGLGNCP
jgi:hypothetical protein